MLPFGNIAPTYALFASIIRLGKVNSGLSNRFVQHYNYFDHVPLYLRLFLSFTRFVWRSLRVWERKPREIVCIWEKILYWWPASVYIACALDLE